MGKPKLSTGRNAAIKELNHAKEHVWALQRWDGLTHDGKHTVMTKNSADASLNALRTSLARLEVFAREEGMRIATW